ncbi:MAG: hypothetical protein AAGC53_21275, partial [Actinomycetota bacterium]
LWDAQAELLAVSATAGSGNDPLGGLVTMWLDFRDANVGVVDGPAAELAAGYVGLSDRWLDAIDAFDRGIQATDAATQDAALEAFEVAIADLTIQGLDADSRLGAATAAQLGARADASSVYLADLVAFLNTNQPLLQRVLLGFTVAAQDPSSDGQAELAEMFDAMEAIFANIGGLEALEPSAATAALHDDHLEFWSLYAQSIRSISDALSAGEEPALTDTLRLARLGESGIDLNVARSEAIAAAFRGQLD